MAHIHDAIDFTVGALIIHGGRVLLVHHKELDCWLPPGGHIELDEDPDQALFREIQEETGLTANDIEIISDQLPRESWPDGRKELFRPQWMDVHLISTSHRHIGLGYVVRAKTDVVKLADGEHRAIRWFRLEELKDPDLRVPPMVIRYAGEAIRVAS